MSTLRTGLIISLLAIAVVILTTIDTHAQLLTMQVRDGARDLGTIDVEFVPGTFTLQARFTPQGRTLEETAQLLGKHHLNWYQLVSWSDDEVVDADGHPLGAPRIDPPPGGYGDEPATSSDETRWADRLPWYLDEGDDPPPGTHGWADGYNLADNVEGDVLVYPRKPPRAGSDQVTTHKVWLVALRADGQVPLWLAGFGWEELGTRADHAKALCRSPITAEYEDLVSETPMKAGSQ